MPIPDAVSVGDSGHIQDHNDISDVLTDYESRISAIEAEDFLDTSSTAQEKIGDLTLSGTVTIANLNVTGTQTINNTQVLEIQDPMIYLAGDQYDEDVVDIGFTAAYGEAGGGEGNHYHTGLIRDVSDSGKWKLFSGVTSEPTSNIIDFTSATYDTLKVGAIEVTSTARVVNLNADKLDSQEGSYYLDWNNLTNKPSPTILLSGDVSGSITLTELSGGTLDVTVADNSHQHTISNIDGLQTSLNSKAASTDLSNHILDTTSVHGIADTSLLATLSDVSTAESNANTYADSAAATAESNANSYSDSLASNYDPAGSAAIAESNANAYTDSQIGSVTGIVQYTTRATWTGTGIQSSVQAADIGIITVTFPVGRFSEAPKVFTQNFDDGSASRMAYAKFTPYLVSSSSVSMQVINQSPPSTVTGGGTLTKAIVDIVALQGLV